MRDRRTLGKEKELLGAEHVQDGVVRDGNVITGRGVGFAIDEGLEIVKVLAGEETAARVKAEIQHPQA